LRHAGECGKQVELLEHETDVPIEDLGQFRSPFIALTSWPASRSTGPRTSRHPMMCISVDSRIPTDRRTAMNSPRSIDERHIGNRMHLERAGSVGLSTLMSSMTALNRPGRGFRSDALSPALDQYLRSRSFSAGRRSGPKKNSPSAVCRNRRSCRWKREPSGSATTNVLARFQTTR